MLAHQVDTGFGCTPTSSMGRLFDAVASLAGIRHVVDYEAEAAIEFEGIARGVGATQPYQFALDGPGAADGPATADAAPVIRAVVDDLRTGVPAAVISARFHAAVTDLIVAFARHARDHTGLDTIALGGGVFQNALLLATAAGSLEHDGFTVLRPLLLPPNDGGISLGQILVGASG